MVDQGNEQHGRSPAEAGSGSHASHEAAEASSPSVSIPNADFLTSLRLTNVSRLLAWEDGTPVDGLFHATELGGEVGELLNVVKKLHREKMGWRGSRANQSELADEIGDVLICLDKLAAHYGVDLATATAAKFNATSVKVGLPHRIVAITRCDFCGRERTNAAERESTHCAPPFTVQPHAFTGRHPADRFASGIEARQGGDSETGSVEDESAVPKADAHPPIEGQSQ